MFITFEGPEGGGKSTQLSLLAAFLAEQGLRVVAAREPGGTMIGDQIRDCLHDVNNASMEAQTEFLLYSASRAQLVREIIQPSLAAGEVVLCDRFADSSIAYQGYGRGLAIGPLEAITRFATGGLVPDLTYLLDIDVEEGLARRVLGAEEMNRLDLEAVAFHRRVRQGYHKMAAADPQRWVIIDAARDPQIIQQELRTLTLQRIVAAESQ